MTEVHNFQGSLQRSKSYEDSEFWFELYKDYFPDLVSAVPIKKDGWAQRAGIDRVLNRGDGTTINIEEKVRETDYGDFLFEYYSNYERKTLGWIAKDLACDYIAYVILPARKCYLLPYPLLRRVWRENGQAWISEYKRVEAHNDGYTTVSVAVPKEEVWRALLEAMVVTWPESVDPTDPLNDLPKG